MLFVELNAAFVQRITNESGTNSTGFVQQITRAFGRVEGSLQYLVKSWSTIVELISVWKRLSEFEAKLKSQELDGSIIT